MKFKNIAMGMLLGLIIVGVAGATKVKAAELDNFYVETTDRVIEVLEDESIVLYDTKEQVYNFYPVCLGDWNYSFKNKKDLDRAVATYKELSNNISHSKDVYVINKLNNNGNIKVFLNDGSSIVYIKQDNKYYFYPACMGDWYLILDNKINLKNCINTYFNMGGAI
ncbi:TPA: hypothetical protein SHW33_002996 [Clostridioides difficile]|uniref:hypothetical protein n=1 Tax=Clostridioides difficile TaxID=1496 RepID=UPI00016C6598|nr:hypothetical protein [Clostridioides difficile]WMU95254.1 hypothetical protein ADOKEBJH_00158 [Clostridioides phage AR1086-1]EGT4176390.1 hypothetical protein [Clostridioides difficile]EGT4183858.1 hypothetical protein [Clostridioides difficile]EGT4214911.1 hypothetical protein [Clostridioides difficile]EGT4628568.1 hypothetical protein [Clostridioides difficile]